jgi:hypothetical protein
VFDGFDDFNPRPGDVIRSGYDEPVELYDVVTDNIEIDGEDALVVIGRYHTLEEAEEVGRKIRLGKLHGSHLIS